MYVASSGFTLLAIPFFMLAGIIMDKSGITDRLVAFANSLVGWVKGGMSYVSIITGMLMGGISGSAPADTAALSSVLVPSMKRLGYPATFSAALQAAAGAIGIIIPPSIPMVVLGSITNISVGAMFLGGLVPGILIGLTYMVFAGFICYRYNYGDVGTDRFSLKALLSTFSEAMLPILAPLIIVGGILTGVFTPTESGVVAVAYTLFLGMFVYRKIRLQDLPGILVEGAVGAANVVFIIGTSAVFSWILTANGVPQTIANVLFSISQSKAFILFAINLIFFVGGMFLEGLALITMFVPMLLPIALQAGIDPIVFGVMVVINIALGTLTPPLGVCMFVASASAGLKFEEVVRQGIPFIMALALNLLLVCLYPGLISTLPPRLLK